MKERKRIAIYHNLSAGGALNTIGEFSKRLQKEYEIDLYTLDVNDCFSEIKFPFSKTYRYKFRKIDLIKDGYLLRLQEDYNFFLRLRSVHKQMANDIDKRKYQFVFVSHDVFIQSPYILRYLRTKSVYYCQEPWRQYYEYELNKERNLKPSLKKFYLLISDYFRKAEDVVNARKSDLILSNSYSSNESIYRAYGKYSYVCHLGVDVSKFKTDIKSKRKNYVYAVGNLSSHKGHEFIIDALSLVNRNNRPELYISSGGIGLENIENLIKYAMKKNVKIKIFSRLSQGKIVKLYREAMVTICVAHLETLGLSAIESFACGTPVIAVKEGGYRDMVQNGYNGLLIDRDVKDLAEAIEKVFSKEFPFEKYVANAIKTIVPYWTWENATIRLNDYVERYIY